MPGAVEESFDAWVRPHVDVMWQLAVRYAGADAADMLQEALLHAWQRRADFDPSRGTLRIWLLMLLADRCRKNWRRRRPLVLLRDERAIDADSDLRLDLTKAITTLPRRQRLAVELHYVLDLPISEVAAVMRCAPGTVKSTLSDARSRLRPLLEVSS